MDPKLTGCNVPAAISPARVEKHAVMLCTNHAVEQHHQQVQITERGIGVEDVHLHHV